MFVSMVILSHVFALIPLSFILAILFARFMQRYIIKCIYSVKLCFIFLLSKSSEVSFL